MIDMIRRLPCYLFYFLTECCDSTAKEDFLQVLDVLKTIKPHPNIIRLLGYCVEAGTKNDAMAFFPYTKLNPSNLFKVMVKDSFVSNDMNNL